MCLISPLSYSPKDYTEIQITLHWDDSVSVMDLAHSFRQSKFPCVTGVELTTGRAPASHPLGRIRLEDRLTIISPRSAVTGVEPNAE